MHVPRHSQLRMKDEIARELLADAEAGEQAPAQQRPVDVSVGRDHRETTPSFLNDDCETDVDILTGGAGDAE